MTASVLRPPADQPASAASPAHRSRRGRTLPHVTMELPAGRRRWSTLVSLALHAAVVALLMVDFVPEGRSHIDRILQGAGGEGPAGGGGGGMLGTGGSPGSSAERLEYVRVAPPPPPAPAAASSVPAIVPPVQPTPVVPPPERTAPVPTPAAQPAPAAPSAGSASATSGSGTGTGTGGGTGGDGSGGTGPGSGGGVGSGVGTGRGSGTGPGTGGGTQANYPPTPTEMFLPPMPVPASVRGFQLIAEFDVDETGRVVGFTFTETRDRGYNRKIRDVLKAIRFRPGHRPDGTPVRMKAQVEYTLF